MFGLCREWGVLLPISDTKTHTLLFVNLIQPDPCAVLSNRESTPKHLNSSNIIFNQVLGTSI